MSLQSKFGIDLNAKDNVGKSAFMFACKNGHSAVANLLMEHSSKFEIDLNAKDDYGETAFHEACYNYHASTVNQMLIYAQEHPNMLDINAKCNKGNTAFFKASNFGKTKLF